MGTKRKIVNKTEMESDPQRFLIYTEEKKKTSNPPPTKKNVFLGISEFHSRNFKEQKINPNMKKLTLD